MQNAYLNTQSTQDPTSIPVILVDVLVHTAKRPFCRNATGGCHEAPTLIAEGAKAVSDGLLTCDEASSFYRGAVISQG